MRAFEVVAALEKKDGRKDKEQILIDAFMNGIYDFFVGAQYACDELISFGVKQVAFIADEDLDPQNEGTITFKDFLALAKKLSSRELTGHAARDAINDMAQKCHGPTWNFFYRRILLKDLRCGAERSTINKVLMRLQDSPEALDLMIPVFSPQLAMDGRKPPHDKKLKGKKYIQLKLDGSRLLTILNKEEGSVRQYSRVGHENVNFPQITEPLKQLLPLIKESIVLDGEVVGKNFQELMKAFGRKTPTENDAKLAVFDIIPLAEFKAGYCSMSQEKRHWLLSEFQTSGTFQKYTGDVVYVLPTKTVDFDTEEGQEEYRKFVNYAAALRAENPMVEGVMVKDLDAPYVGKRVDKWLKVKPFVSVSLKMISVELGDKEGKYKNVIGNANFVGEDDDRQIKVSVSSGIPDDLRELWLTEAPIGYIHEIEADDFTLDEDAIAEAERTGNPPIYSLRFPRWKGQRGFKPGEKV